MSLPILLPLLSTGEFRSGQALADALGVSRTAVWKQLNKFSRETGVEIESVRGKGYRIPGGLDLLNAAHIKRALSPVAAPLLRDFALLRDIDSTNAELLRRAQLGERGGLVCCAEQQSAGRGRRGRTWISPFASNLYLSVLWDFRQGAAALEGLSLAVGVAVSHALADCGLPPVQLKWPNDILHQGAKLGGILLEMTGDADGACQVVIGIGLNVAMPAQAGEGIDQAWTDIRAMAASERQGGDAPPARTDKLPGLTELPGRTNQPGRNDLLAAVLNHLLPLLAEFETQGFGPWRDHWQSLDAHAGQQVVLDTGARQTAGIARGVDERGALRLETTTGITAVYGGEISLRPVS
ncbi:MAG: BirA family biotin operon repressor/biotin-[acetyl-CoA-carboxylase] ligase [Bacteroidia bacterium]|jgi:BirA family biotin operon repressor/biotin-[acetyl-CoA-carboxylase] ligase